MQETNRHTGPGVKWYALSGESIGCIEAPETERPEATAAPSRPGRSPSRDACGPVQVRSGRRNMVGEVRSWQAMLGITPNTPVRSRQETIHGSVRRRPDGCGLGRGLLDWAADIIAARARSESLIRHSDVFTHMHMSHAPPPEPNRARIIWWI